MPNLFQTSLTRRSILKAGSLSVILLALSSFQSKVIAQGASVNTANTNQGSLKPNGLISFNAGWMIPVEDQKALLALEEKKNKELKAASVQAPQNPDASVELAKPAKKTWSEKLQEAWKQAKSFF